MTYWDPRSNRTWPKTLATDAPMSVVQQTPQNAKMCFLVSLNCPNLGLPPFGEDPLNNGLCLRYLWCFSGPDHQERPSACVSQRSAKNPVRPWRTWPTAPAAPAGASTAAPTAAAAATAAGARAAATAAPGAAAATTAAPWPRERWAWLKIYGLGLRRCWSLFPSKGPKNGLHVFEPQPDGQIPGKPLEF